jgi:N-acetylmuramic acid 6-phosphate (MurNAc-6-P) etherase
MVVGIAGGDMAIRRAKMGTTLSSLEDLQEYNINENDVVVALQHQEQHLRHGLQILQ